jgi:hypothetical protein
MIAASIDCHEDELGYERPDGRQLEPLSDRVAISASRKLTGQERVSRQARYSRRSAPQRKSGAHCRGNKRYGI